MTLTELSCLISQVESEHIISLDDYNIKEYILEGFVRDAENDIPFLLVLPTIEALVFTNAPHSAANELADIDLLPESEGITWMLKKIGDL